MFGADADAARQDLLNRAAIEGVDPDILAQASINEVCGRRHFRSRAADAFNRSAAGWNGRRHRRPAGEGVAQGRRELGFRWQRRGPRPDGSR